MSTLSNACLWDDLRTLTDDIEDAGKWYEDDFIVSELVDILSDHGYTLTLTKVGE